MEHLYNFFKSHYVPELGLMDPRIIMTAKEMAAIVERSESSARNYLMTMVERNLLTAEKITKTVDGVEVPAYFVKVIDFTYRREPPKPRKPKAIPVSVSVENAPVAPTPSPKVEKPQPQSRKFKRDNDVKATKERLISIMQSMDGQESNRTIAKRLGKSVGRTKALILELKRERRVESVYKRHYIHKYQGWANDRLFWVNF